MDSRRTRAVRGVIAGVTATFFAAFSHGIASAAELSVVAVLCALILSSFICILLAGRGLSRLRLSGAVLVSQALFHTLFAVFPASAPVTGDTGHRHHGPAVLDFGSGMLPHAAHNSPAMWIGHALAAVGTALALIHGEQVLRALIALFGMVVRVRALFQPQEIFALPAASRPFFYRRRPRLRILRDSIISRGPPRGVAHA